MEKNFVRGFEITLEPTKNAEKPCKNKCRNSHGTLLLLSDRFVRAGLEEKVICPICGAEQ
tara:strand:+ start:452 stop:631 length:180 start_codon:yes stop_codon:yes gene_type:complete